jgi:hypothetical protein
MALKELLYLLLGNSGRVVGMIHIDHERWRPVWVVARRDGITGSVWSCSLVHGGVDGSLVRTVPWLATDPRIAPRVGTSAAVQNARR